MSAMWGNEENQVRRQGGAGAAGTVDAAEALWRKGRTGKRSLGEAQT